MAGEATGLVGDVRGLAGTALRAVRTRLELLAIEASEEKAWALRFLVVAVAGLYLVTFGLLLAVLALVLWASEANRPAILAAFAAAFVAVGAGGFWYMVGASKRRNSLFQETIAVLKGDEQALSQPARGTGD
ncbi:MAG TPA: phage holin family protein [Usitatibacter sp.]|nr:phage holin family protein [Usitatibacter sp.]